MVQKVLQDDRGGDGVHLAALAQATRVAALAADDRLGLLGGLALVPQTDGYADHAGDNAGEVLRPPRLRSLRAVGVQRQADHHLDYPFTLRQRRKRIKHRRQATRTVEHNDRACEQARRVTHRHTDAAFAGVNAEHPTLTHRRATWAPGR
jgi:hypothetical protein